MSEGGAGGARAAKRPAAGRARLLVGHDMSRWPPGGIERSALSWLYMPLMTDPEPVPEAGGVVGPKYRATRALRGPRASAPRSDAGGLSAHTRVVRSVGREDRPLQWGIVHEHTRRPTPVFMNTKTINSNFHWPIGVYEDRPSTPQATHANSS